MTVYLSGPMMGQPDFGRKAFNAAEAALRENRFLGWRKRLMMTLRPNGDGYRREGRR